MHCYLHCYLGLSSFFFSTRLLSLYRLFHLLGQLPTIANMQLEDAKKEEEAMEREIKEMRRQLESQKKQKKKQKKKKRKSELSSAPTNRRPA